MASKEDLIPKGLPQGSRQENVAAFRAAGLPVGSEQAAPEPVIGPPPAPAGAPPIGPTVPARQAMQNFDVFDGRTPNPIAAPLGRDIIFQRVRDSGNAVLQDVFTRMSGYKEG